ncbi:hypothetical protein A8C56_23680 [Niabella ginsenosidivorans]|uniref:Sulfatase N-terminal domain-containing protein n=1 Tax=Niabella ginsenosidivorans TaxID=1176587 RepID=A0A1A9IAI7_9BACT|nr:sulfatase-like hydrolase/transferase [Niabella ginsenosidivorans]ANH83574.1 hypothetical protein A8C56_23680 [Niabella ginsenosidivorans]
MNLKWISIVVFCLWAGLPVAGQEIKPPKNVLIIITDEQSADAISAVAGSRYFHTPNIDALAKNGVRFARAYCANPLCTPSRSSMFTGRYPHELGVMDNKSAATGNASFPVMGTYFTAKGYETGYVGKWHVPLFPLKNTSVSGFQWLQNNQLGGADSLLPGAAVQFINKKRAQPFLLVVSFVNPHNICEWARGDQLPDGAIGVPPALAECPPLLPNHAPTFNESDINREMRRFTQSSPQFPVGNFTDSQWRAYRWAYYRLIEKVDAYIGTVLKALKASGQYENTLIVFLSDHGDMQGAHQWNQKTVFYEEAARVPFILSSPGLKPGTSDDLVNTGIDLIPTICAYAGIDLPAALPGCNVLKPDPRRQYVVVANRLAVGKDIPGKKTFKPEGRMVRSDHFKYWVYDEGKRRESLFDMDEDPGEMQDLARLPQYREVLEAHRHYLKEWAKKYSDNKALEMLKDQNL